MACQNSKLNNLFATLSDKTPIPFQLKDFGDGFLFGAATSAYQVEGAVAEGGRGPSIWDDFALKNPDKIDNGCNGNVAINHYNTFKEDVKLMKSTGLNAYRFSISWSRVLPGGKLRTGINKEGIKFYNDLIDALLAQGIEPFVTLFHWDLPLALQQDYGGFLNDEIVSDFHDYAELCFFHFGDRVKYWLTFNEPWTYTHHGYVSGAYPPNRGSSSEGSCRLSDEPIGHRHCWEQYACKSGNPGTEPYIVAHNIILAHAAAVATYKSQFQAHQGGKISMANVIAWFEPLEPCNPHDHEAAHRAIEFGFGWFVAPLVTGDYPKRMKDRVKDRLPVFTPAQAKLVKGSYDFLGINYYTAYYATTPGHGVNSNKDPNYLADMNIKMTSSRHGVPIGLQGASSWLNIVPWGIHKAMDYIRKQYHNPEIYITENGVDTKTDTKHTIESERNDQIRVEYHRDHLLNLKNAIHDGSKIKGYFAWSLCDNFEWKVGYTVRFGLFYVDFEDGRLTRYPKKSALWLANFLGNRISLKRQIQRDDDKNVSFKKTKPNNE